MKHRRKVLVVDDERNLTDITVDILSMHGYEARGCYGGRQGIEVARTFCPDIVLLDVLMPDLNGIDVALVLRAEQPNLRILLISGQASVANLLSRARAQGYDFPLLSKPLAPETLLAKLQDAASA